MKRLSILLALLLSIVAPAFGATDVGIYQRANCTTLTNPATGKTFCFDQTDNRLYVYDGTGWVSDTANSLGVVNVKDRRFGAKCDGVADDTVGVQAAATAADGKVLSFGGCSEVKITTEISLPNNIVIDLAGATIKPTGDTRTFVKAAPSATASTTVSSGGTLGSRTIEVADATGIAVGQWYSMTTSDGLFPVAMGKIVGVAGTTLSLDTPLPVTFPTGGGVTLDLTTYASLYGTLILRNGIIDGSASTLVGAADATHAGVGLYAGGYEHVIVDRVQFNNFTQDSSNNAPLYLVGPTRHVVLQDITMRGNVIRNAHISIEDAYTAEVIRPDIGGSGFGVGFYHVAFPTVLGGQVVGRRAQELAADPGDNVHSVRGIKMGAVAFARVLGAVVGDFGTNIRVQDGVSFDISHNITVNGGVSGGASIMVNGAAPSATVGHGRLVGNSIHQSLGGGILIGDTGGYNIVAENTINGGLGYGIYVNGQGNRILANIVKNWAASGAASFGLYTPDATGNNVIDGNVFSNSLSPAPVCIRAAGTGDVVGQNNVVLTDNPLGLIEPTPNVQLSVNDMYPVLSATKEVTGQSFDRDEKDSTTWLTWWQKEGPNFAFKD